MLCLLIPIYLQFYMPRICSADVVNIAFRDTDLLSTVLFSFFIFFIFAHIILSHIFTYLFCSY